jgi:ribosomal-protein-alanine N-acetyltransferase
MPEERVVNNEPLATLRTVRLVLRPYTPDDAPSLRRWLSDPDVAGMTLTVPHPYPETAADEFIRALHPAWVERKRANWAVTRASDSALIGGIGLQFALAHRRAEVGYWIAKPEWGNGYASEATRCVLAFGFDEMQLHRIEAHHFMENPASGRVLERVGMSPEGVHRGVVWRDDRPRDLKSYAILRDDPRR